MTSSGPWALVWEPIASPLKIGAGAALLAALAVFAFVRIVRMHPAPAAVLLAMRLAVIAAVTALLFGPSREIPRDRQEERPHLLILVDTSESMRTIDCAGMSRMEFVARDVLSPARLDGLKRQYDVELRGFDSRVRPLSIERLHRESSEIPTGKTTHLAEAVSQAVSQLPDDSGDVVLVISDGRDTDDAPMQPPAALAAAKHAPIYAVGVGGDRSETDAALLAVPMQDAVLPGEPAGVLVKVYQSGLDGRTVTARLKSGDETQHVELPFGTQQMVETQFNIEREEPGQYELDVLIDPVAGEGELSNNYQTVFVEVMKQRIRVLLLEGEPFWDTKFLAQSLRKDAQVELTQLTQIGRGKQETIVTRREAASPRIPRSVEDWGEYDVVILGRGLERLLSVDAARSLAEYVLNSGGHVVFARGPAWDSSSPEGQSVAAALEIVSPVEWGESVDRDAPLALAPSGRTAAWFASTKMGVDVESALARLPGFAQSHDVIREKSGALVLMRSTDGGGPDAGQPAIVRMPAGRGQVVAILGEGLWRWSLLPPDLQDLRGFYDTFWSNLVRWLALGGDFAPGEQVSLQLSRTSARLGDEVVIDVVYRQTPPAGVEPRLEAAGPDGEPLTAALHLLPGPTPRYRAALQPEQTGVHTVRVRTPGVAPSLLEKRLNVYEVNLERLQTSANFLALKILAEHSGGAMFEAANIAQLGEELQRRRLSLIVPPEREYVWDRGVIMTILLLWAGGEWLFRRAVGLW